MIHFTVMGMPAPQGSKRHVGNGRMVESSKKVKPWREDVRAAALEFIRMIGGTVALQSIGPGKIHWARSFPLDIPLRVEIVFTLPAPKSLPKTKRSHPCKTPDLDKLLRSTFDAITSAALWADDARVVEVSAAKTYPQGTPGAHPKALHAPGAVISISEVA